MGSWRGGPWRAVVAVGLLVTVAEFAVVLLSPPAVAWDAAEPAEWGFPPAFVEKVAAFGRPQAAIHALHGLLELVALFVFARRQPRFLAAQGIVRGLLAGSSAALVVVAVRAPFRAWERARTIAAGWKGWSSGQWLANDLLGDLPLLAGVAVGGAMCALLLARFPRRWWVILWAGLVAVAVAWVATEPLVDPSIRGASPWLPKDRLPGPVASMIRPAPRGIPVYVAPDAERGTQVVGLGPTQRIVLDPRDVTLDSGELNAVLAHELGHVAHKDALRAILWVMLVAPAAAVCTRYVAQVASPRSASGPTVAAVIAATMLVATIAMTISNQLSRRVEAQADRFALEATGDADGFIRNRVRSCISDFCEPRPPGLVAFLYATHPNTMERIGIALAFRRRG